MLIEAKNNEKLRKYKKAMTQLIDGQMRVQKVVNSIPDFSNAWKFISVYILPTRHRIYTEAKSIYDYWIV